MILQGEVTFVVVLYIIIATIFLWMMLWLAARWVISRDFAKNNVLVLLLSALLLVVLVPIVTDGIMFVLSLVGELMQDIRDIFGTPGPNYVGLLAPIISFLLFLVILKLLVGMDWKDALWVGLIGIFLLYLLYTLLPELDVWGVVGYT